MPLELFGYRVSVNREAARTGGILAGAAGLLLTAPYALGLALHRFAGWEAESQELGPHATLWIMGAAAVVACGIGLFLAWAALDELLDVERAR